MINTCKTTSPIPAAADPAFLMGRKRLLIVRLRNLGDCILATPVVRALKIWNPLLRITLLVEQPFAGVFRGNPWIDRLEILPRNGSWARRFLERWRCSHRLRLEGYDWAWNLHGGSTSLYLTLASQAPVRMGFAHFRQSSAYTLLVPSASEIWGHEPVHTVETQLAPLKWMGIIRSAEEYPAEVFTTEEARNRADRFLAAAGISRQPFVLVQPTATLQSKQWPEERFGRLIERIRCSTGLAVVLSVGPGEESVAGRVLRHQTGTLPVFQGSGLEEFKAVLERCLYFIGNDSGPMHLASALKRPVLAIFSSSNFDAWHPWGTRFESVRTDLPCSPCPGYRCYRFETPRCVQEISEDQVWRAFQRLASGN